MNKYSLKLMLVTLLFSCHLFGQGQKTWSSSDIKLALKKVNTVGSVLYIAAHPDDENTRLLAYFANEKCLRTAYLSMNRGDGGQNLIGTEQGELMGLIRTQELLAARRIDGAEQFFTRSNDFGYSKGPEETMRIWGHDSILADVVWIIRCFKPDIIVTRFPTTGEGGHGHHTASAILAGEAFKAAGDPKMFPEQLKYVSVWQAKSLYWNTFNFGSGTNTIDSSQLKIDVGVYNDLLGKGYGEMAAESRSMHKSQGFGVPKQRGTFYEFFKHIAGDSSATDLFVGINQTWKRIKGGDKVASYLKQAYEEFQPEKPEKIVPYLLSAYAELKDLTDDYWKTQKMKEIENLIIACSGMYLDASADDYSVSPGKQLKITTTVIQRNNPSIKLENVVFGTDKKRKCDSTMTNNKVYTIVDSIFIPADTKYSTPYWLEKKHGIGIYNVEDQQLRGRPENAPPVMVTFNISFNKQEISFKRPVQYKWVDPVDGEKYRPLEITPAVTANIEAPVIMFMNNQTKQIKVVLKAGINDALGTAKLELGKGDWKVEPASASFNLKKKGDEITLTFKVTAPVFFKPEMNDAITAKASVEINNTTISKSVVRVNYPHIPIQTLFPDAESKFVPIYVNKKGNNIGYIPGAGDEIPQCLKQIGYEVTTLTDDMLSNKSLADYDAIVVGIRAYNTNERMQYYYTKLMDYVNNGGNLIVQYNTNNFLSSTKGDIGPYPFKISRDRVTVEEAPMTFDNPNHPLLNTPNKISDKDFDGWIQERGLYFATDWDSHYETIFSCNDPGEKPSKGSVIVTKFGKGYFIYTGLSFFRELPAGVTGAYRLLVNMISAGR